MKTSIRIIIVSLFLSLTASILFAQKPNVVILATGGTIAGTGSSSTQSKYTAGQLAVEALLDAVPELNDIATLRGEQIVRIGSQDMSDEVWLTLAKRINAQLLQDSTDAVVITHGTDTLEETAFFLSLTLKTNKPVVLLGAMRPSTALGADGPLNLYNAVLTAVAPESKNRGVLVAMNGIVLSARGVTKTNTLSVETFQSPMEGALGYIHNGKVHYNRESPKKQISFDLSRLNELPKVGIVYSYSNVEDHAVQALISNKYEGIVHAGVGNGNIHKNLFPTLIKARKNGVLVVRSSRVPTGATTLGAEVNDEDLQFIASQSLNPQKARVLLQLALTKTKDWKVIQEYFNEY